MIRRTNIAVKLLAVIALVGVIVLGSFGLHWGALNDVDGPNYEYVCVWLSYWMIMCLGWWWICVQLLIIRVFKKVYYIRIFKKIFGFHPERTVELHASSQVRRDLKILVENYEETTERLDRIRADDPFYVGQDFWEREKKATRHFQLVKEVTKQKEDACNKMWDGYDTARYFRLIGVVRERKYSLILAV